MTPEEAIEGAKAGRLAPVVLVLGEERFLADRVVSALRAAGAEGGIAGFNEDRFTSNDTSAEAVVGAARMLPMMAPRRVVVLRGVERWESAERKGAKTTKQSTKQKSGIAHHPLDVLADYANNPSESTLLVLVASKLNGQRRLVTTLKKAGALVACDPLPRRALPRFAESEAKRRGHRIESDVAELLAELAGPELASVADAVERLSLYVGEGKAITEQAVAELVTRVRPSTVWELVDHLAARRMDRALDVLATIEGGAGSELPTLGAVTSTVRQLVRLDDALARGVRGPELAQAAGMPPFKVDERRRSLERLPPGTLGRWLSRLAETDLALKSSRRPGRAVLEAMIVSMCTE